MTRDSQQQLRSLIQQLDALRQRGDSGRDATLAAMLEELARILQDLSGTAAHPARQSYQPDFFLTDLSGTLVEISAGLKALLAPGPAPLVGRPIVDLLTPPTRAAIQKRLADIEATGPLQIWELDLQPPDRDPIQFVTIVRLLDGEDGSRLVDWQIYDMADVEESGVTCELHCLRSLLLDDLPGMAYRCLNDPDYTMIYISEGCRELTGYRPADLLNNHALTFADLIVPEDREHVWKEIQSAVARQARYQITYRIQTAQGQEKQVWEQGRMTATTYQGHPVLEGFITDVTAQYEIELALLQRTEEVSLLYEASTQLSQSLDSDTLYETLHAIINRKLDCDGLFISDYDPATELLTCAFGWGKTGRIDVSQFPALPLNKAGGDTQSLVIQTGTPLNLPDFAAQARTSHTRFQVDDAGQLTPLVADGEDGDETPGSALILPLKREGQVVGVLQIFSDRPDAYSEDDLNFVEALSPIYEAVAANVALYRRAQQEIAERTAAEEAIRFQALLLDSISQAVIAADLEGRVTYWNSYATTMYGWSESEALGNLIGTLIVPAEAMDEAVAIMQQALSSEGWAGEFTVQRKDGTTFPAMVSDTPIQDDAGRLIGVVGISWDITERKFTEEILENQARQMAMINQVGGQINDVLDLDRVLNRAAQLVQSTFGYQHVGLFILDEDSHRAIMRARDGVYASRFPPNHSLRLGEGIVGWVAEHGRRLLANDVEQEAHYHNPFTDGTIKSELAVPIQTGDEVLGVLDVQSQDLDAFDQTDVLVLETLADQLAIAIQNARLYEAERRQRELAEALSKLAAILSSTLEPDEVLERILSHVGHVIPHDASNIFVMEDGQGRYVCWQGYTPEMEAHMRARSIPSRQNVLLQAMTEGEIILLPETYGSPIWPTNPALGWIRSHLGVPIRYKGTVSGYLSLDSSVPGHFTPDDANRLQAIADQAAIAIQNAYLYQAERVQRQTSETLSEMAGIISSTLELDEIIPHVLPYVERIIRHDASSIMLFENGGARFVARHGPLSPDIPNFDQLWIDVDDYPLFQQMAQGEPILIPDTTTAPLWLQSNRVDWIRSYLGVPVRSQGVVFGFLNLASETPNYFSTTDADRLQAIAGQFAVAIRNARLYHAEREQRHMAEALREMAAIMSSTLELDGIILHVLPYVERIIPHDASNIILFQGDKTRFVEWRGQKSTNDLAYEELQIDADTYPQFQRMAKGESILIPDTANHPDWVQTPRMERTRSYLGVPIRSQGVVLGFLNLTSETPHHFTQADVGRLEAVSDQMAIAIRNAQLYQSEREQRRMAEALRDLGAVLSSTLELEVVMSHVLEQIGHVVKHDASILLLIEDGAARIASWRNFPPSSEAFLKSLRFDLDLSDYRRMLTTGDPVIIPDTATYPDWVGGPEIAWIRCQMSVPIRYQGTAIGFLGLDNAQPDSFTRIDAERLQAIADQAAIAIQNARLYQAEREQHRLTEALRDMASSISGTLSINELLQRLLENVGRVVPHDRANIMLISGNAAEVAYVRGYAPQDAEVAFKTRLPLETPNLHHMQETGKPYIIPDTRTYEDWVDVAQQQRVRSYIGVPIQARSAVIGFLNVDSYTPNFFTEEHAENLMAFVHQASVAIQNARLYQDLEMYSESLEQAVKERTVELNRSRERVETILNSSSDAIIFLESEGMIRQANPAFNALFGYDVDEAFGHLITELAVAEDGEMLDDAIQISAKGTQPVRAEITACRKDGSQFDADVAMSPVRSGETLLGLVCSLRDITARKASEKALKDALEKERELGQLKSRFVSMASHEFRTPLTTILSSTFLLENRIDRMNDEQKARHFQKIKGSVEHMNQLLEDVLTIGTAEAGRLEFNPEPLNFKALCREAVEEAQLGAETRVNLTFGGDSEGCQVIMDGKLVRQILDNLLSNAIKYSPQGGTVQIDVQCNRRSTTIRVKDEGIGIPEDDQKHLFEPFHRGGNVAGIQGTGLGLAITKRSVDLHQGSLTLESHEGAGTTFTVVLPNKPPILDTATDD